MQALIGIIALIFLSSEFGFWNVVVVIVLLSIFLLFMSMAFAASDTAIPAVKSAQPKRRRTTSVRRTTTSHLSTQMGAITSGLVIDEPWISKIIRGEKTWEMRSRATTKRERVALIRKGTGLIVGVATVTNVLGPFNDEQISNTYEFHRVPLTMIGKWRYAWSLGDVKQLQSPIPYIHSKGAVTWVNLDSSASLNVSAADKGAI